MIPKSIKREPTKVKKNKRVTARIFLALEPDQPIKIYIGISVASKKI